MMTYKDMTFCDDDCDNTGCFRQYHEEKNVEKMPVSFASFKDGCSDYKPKEDNDKR